MRAASVPGAVGQLYRIPRTSVLGHMLIVAILSYLFSLAIDACPRRRTNNYFAGLFHDLPEVLTKDVISPVKRAATGVDRFVKEFERDEMQRRIYRPKLIPQAWEPEMRMFTEDEFASKVTVEGRLQHTTSDAIGVSYNDDRYNPVDGELVEAADDLAAFMEAYLALENGPSNPQLQKAVQEKEEFYYSKMIAGVNLGKLFEEFE